MSLALVILSTVIAAEIFVRRKTLTKPRRIVAISQRARRILARPEGEGIWKERAVQICAFRLLGASLAFLVDLLLVAAPLVAAGIIGMATGYAVFAEFSSALGLFASIAIAALYLYLRNRIVQRHLQPA